MGVSQFERVLSQYRRDIQIIIHNSGYLQYAVQQFVQCLTNPGEKEKSEGGCLRRRTVTLQKQF